MRVFILQFSNRYDASAANEHGRLVYLVDEQLNPFNPNETVRCIRDKLIASEFDSDKDAIALTGPSNLISLFLAVLAHDYTKIKLLLFDPKTSTYTMSHLNLGE